jgi:hypothetical protein
MAREQYKETKENGSDPIEGNPSGATISNEFDPVTFKTEKPINPIVTVVLAYLGFKFFF